ncbi:MAG: hypothetical protein KDJ45_05405 [Hyphomicrobiaceae bacterium]|nr:hypothetical protein [Hyphomicrobiaceae bacterium]MCC0011640.1 hypothetical protein [Hyphomicrobiaceae bacterium]
MARLLFVLAIATAAAASASTYLFWSQYWRWRDCFSDQGRCFDPNTQVVYFEQSGIAWGGLALLFLVLTLVLLVLLSRR